MHDCDHKIKQHKLQFEAFKHYQISPEFQQLLILCCCNSRQRREMPQTTTQQAKLNKTKLHMYFYFKIGGSYHSIS